MNHRAAESATSPSSTFLAAFSDSSFAFLHHIAVTQKQRLSMRSTAEVNAPCTSFRDPPYVFCREAPLGFLGFLGFPGSLPLVPLLHRFHADLADAHHGPTARAGQAAPDASPVAAVATSFELSLARAGIAWQGIPSRWTSWITLRAIASPALRDKFALPMAA